MRVHVNAVRMTLHRADVLEAYLNHSEVIEHAKVYERTGDVLIQYKGSRAGAVTVLSHYKFDNPELDSLVTSADSRKINQEYQERFVNLVVFRAFHKLFLPAPVRAVITVFKAIEFICRGLVCLWHRKLEVEVLDALSIGVSLLRSDFNTAGSVMFLLNVGALLEEWTRKKSLDDLARSMSLNVDRVWVRSQGTEVLMPITKVKAGDEIIVRSGNMVPLDGTVIEGEAMVNQAALTGESMPVRKIAGATVYAGTVVEEGECVFAANAVDGASRYDKIVSMIEESEKLKSGTENHALELADRLPVLGLLPHGLAEPVAALALPFVGGHPFGHAVHYLAWENLKGVAISLTIGMAVDANVLIFERMREEVKNGRSTRDAAEAGFTESWATIVDSNLTTLVAAFVLLYFGTGPVRGFAVTLAIGIATSMFTSVTVTRLIITGWLQKYKPTKLPI